MTEAAGKIVVHDVKYDFSTTVKSDDQEISKSLEKIDVLGTMDLLSDNYEDYLAFQGQIRAL